MNISSAVQNTGKFLDQPLLVSKLSGHIPKILIGGAAAFGTYDTFKTPKEKRKKKAIKNALVLSTTVTSALAATRGLAVPSSIKKFLPKTLGNLKINGLLDIPGSKEIKNNATKNINDFLNQSSVNKETSNVLKKAKSKILSIKEVGILSKNLNKSESGKALFEKLIPSPVNPTLKESMGEIVKLSKLGAVPVAGGIAGGIAADSLTDKDWKKKVPDKIDEGLYQYLANIVLCNVGAAAAVVGMEAKPVKNFVQKAGINPKLAKAGAMVAGITATGIVGGSFLANAVCKKVIDPLMGKKSESKCSNLCKDVYSDRHPELLDASLHVDDIATVGILSGFKWIEPALPLLYAVSGYRSGIGYRNGEKPESNSTSDVKISKNLDIIKNNFLQKIEKS